MYLLKRNYLVFPPVIYYYSYFMDPANNKQTNFIIYNNVHGTVVLNLYWIYLNIKVQTLLTKTIKCKLQLFK